MLSTQENCPCCSGKSYNECCSRFITGQEIPATPEQLMRSRYSAYALGNVDYIGKTMKSPASDDFNPEEALEWAQQVTWKKLKVIRSSANAKKGVVEFRAHYSYQGKNQILQEISEFLFENGQWFYVDGKMV